MKLISWNIQASAGAKLQKIVGQLSVWDADVVALSETNPKQSVGLQDQLRRLGYAHIHAPAHPKDRGALIASKTGFTARPARTDLELPEHRWVEVSLPKAGVIVACTYFPATKSGIQAFWPKAHAACISMRDEPVLLVGDLNSGHSAFDSTTAEFSGDPWFSAMPLLGFTDLWRRKNGAERDFSWHSGKGGRFRIDHAFGTDRLRRRVRTCRYLHEGRKKDVSDHSALLVEVR